MEYEREAAGTNIKREQAVIAWMRENALPIQSIEAGNGFADLQPLKRVFEGTKVVGLGETTHGTREIFQLKHRLVEYLVTQMGFTVFTIEAPYAACLPINDYVLHGVGDRATVLTGQWYVVWDTEELAALIDWMRAYNETVSEDKKVHFYGLDFARNGNGRTLALDYLRKVAPEQVNTTTTLFAALEVEEEKGPRRVDEASEQRLVELAPHLQALLDFLDDNQQRLVDASSAQEFAEVRHAVRVMQQWLMTQPAALRPPDWGRNVARTNYMAENLITLAQQAPQETKFIVWQHNGHVRVVNTAAELPNMGARYRETFGDGYYATGFEFNQGSFHTRIGLPTGYLGDLKEVTLPSSVDGSLAWYLAQVGADVLFLDLRAPVSDLLVAEWLEQPQRTHFVSWGYDEKATDYLETRSLKEYDGLIFIKQTTASRPTPNALRRIANQEGL